MINVNARLSGDFSQALANFEKQIQEKVTIAGVAAMAKVVYDAARSNADAMKSEKEHYFYGTSFAKTGQRYLFQPGALRDSIYRVYSPEKSEDTKKTYRVSWNDRKAPYGHMVEYGTSRASAHPFLRPAFDHIGEAVNAGKARMAEKLSEIGQP